MFFNNLQHFACILISVFRKLSTLAILSFLSLPPANEVWGKVIFSEACVILSIGGSGTPPWADTPPGPGIPPPGQTPPRDQVHPWADTPPGPGTPLG